jgi:hypothetical protein
MREKKGGFFDGGEYFADRSVFGRVRRRLGVRGVLLISIMMRRSMMLVSCRRRVGIEGRPRPAFLHVAHAEAEDEE